MTAEDLIVAGYKKYPPAQYETCDACFRKRFRSGNDTLFSVNVRQWNRDPIQGWDSSANLYQEDGRPWIVLQWHGISEKTPDDLERFFMQAYRVLECIPDPHNQSR